MHELHALAVLALAAGALILSNADLGTATTPNDPLVVATNGMVVDSAMQPAQDDGTMSALDPFPVSTPGQDVTVIRSEGFHGRCPVCEGLHLVSAVSQGWCTTTLMGTYAWFDTAGNYHFRDPNTTTCEHRCSAKHAFRVVFIGVEELVLRPDGTRIR